MNSRLDFTAKSCLHALVASAFLVTAHSAVSQTWVSNSVPVLQWSAVASSADAKRLEAAVYGGPVYCSTNSGATWATNNAPASNWISVASSADGMRLAAAIGSTATGGIYTSRDGGATWRLSGANSAVWKQVVSSADGTRLFAAMATGSCYYSTNSGTNWTAFLGTPSVNWSGVACSADGMTLVAVKSIDDPPVYVSTNAGVSWVTNNSIIGMPGAGAASSADGSRLFVISDGFNYVSTNSGISFQQVASVANGNVIVSSADGTQLLAGFLTSPSYSIFTSTNSGAAWTTNIVTTTVNNSLNSVSLPTAMSADGTRLIFASGDTRGVYTPNSGHSGPIFTLQTVPSPQLNISLLNTNLELSWIVPSTNFVLQQSPDLFTWMALTNAPVLNLATLQDQILVSPTNSNEFYRLATP